MLSPFDILCSCPISWHAAALKALELRSVFWKNAEAGEGFILAAKIMGLILRRAATRDAAFLFKLSCGVVG